MNTYFRITIFLFGLALLGGCSGTTDEALKSYNKSALYWYDHLTEAIVKGNLDKADKYYLSLKSEHARSPLLPTATLILAQAHSDKEEYLLAGYYLDSYKKRFGNENNADYIDFLKLKASFLGIKDINKDQKLITDALQESERFLYRYPDSPYLPLVDTIRTRLLMAQYLLNENIAALYARIGKKEAAKIYREKNENSPLKQSDIAPPKRGIFSKIFD